MERATVAHRIGKACVRIVKDVYAEVRKDLRAVQSQLAQAEARDAGPFETRLALIDQAILSYKDSQRRAAEAAARELAEAERRRLEELRAAEVARLRAQAEEAATKREQREYEKTAKHVERLAIDTDDVVRDQVTATEGALKAAGLPGEARYWSAQVDDVAALIRWVAADVAGRRQYLIPNGPALNSLAKQLKSEMQVPGVRAICTRKLRG